MRTAPFRLGIVGFALLALGPGPAAPQGLSSFDEPAEAPLPRYRVEIILFANTNVDATEEDFAYEASPPAPPPLAAPEQRRFPIGFDPRARARELQPPGAGPAAALDPPDRPPGGDAAADPGLADAATAADTDPFEVIDPFGELAGSDPRADRFEFRVLRPDELELDDAYARLDRLGAYRPLAHVGWEQAGLDERQARAVDLASLGVASPRGTLTLFLERFLHLAVDLDYEAPRTAAAATARDFAGFEGLSELAVRPHYEIRTQRRARSGEIHYVDHPYFGLLFVIRPAPEEEAPVDDTAVLSPAA